MTIADRLKNDALSRPTLFLLRGPMKNSAIQAWNPPLVHSLPAELLDFWAETGGGDIFESEVFLHPCNLAADLLDVDGSDEVLVANEALRREGLPTECLAFLAGAFIGAWRRTDGRYLLLDAPDLQARQTFGSLEAWYVDGLRPIFAEKYRLPGLRVPR